MNPEPVQITHFAMGTVMSHRAFGPSAAHCLAAVQAEVARLEALLSRFLPGSDISRINESAGIQSERVSPDTCAVLSKSIEFSRAFPGFFDVTIGPLVSLWNIGKEGFAPPDEDCIQQVLPLVNAQDLVLDPYHMTAGLRNLAQSVDLGGIGKGYAADKVLEIYQKFGVTSAFSNLGGNVVTLGTKPDGAPWRIGIQHPRDETRLLGSVAVAGQSVVTSGDYQRYSADRQGKKHHHILNPRTGHPAETGLASVTIVTGQSVTADALSTLLFVAGMDKCPEILQRYPQAGAVLVDVDLHVFVTRNLEDCFQADEGIEVIFLN